MPKFDVLITRSAVETVVLHVEAASELSAEELVMDALGQPHRVTLDEIKAVKNITVASVEINGDEESSWEVG